MNTEPTPEKPTPSEVWDRLCSMSENAEKARAMSNSELAEALRRTVGDHLPMHELGYDLVEVAADRLSPENATKEPASPKKVIVTWGWKAQPDWGEINLALTECWDSKCFEVATRTSDFGLVIASIGTTPEDAQKYYDEHWNDPARS